MGQATYGDLPSPIEYNIVTRVPPHPIPRLHVLQGMPRVCTAGGGDLGATSCLPQVASLPSELPPREVTDIQRHFPPAFFQEKHYWTAASESPPSSPPRPSAVCRQPNTSWKVGENSGSCSGCLNLMVVLQGDRVMSREESWMRGNEWPPES